MSFSNTTEENILNGLFRSAALSKPSEYGLPCLLQHLMKYQLAISQPALAQKCLAARM